MAASIPNELGAEGAWAGAQALSHPAEEYENDATVEAYWAMKAYEHAEVYFNILCSVDPLLLKLTPHDNEIYEEFRKKFPTFEVSVLDEEALKSPPAKEKWRPFCNSFEHVEDFNFATLVRLDSTKEYSEENSILGGQRGDSASTVKLLKICNAEKCQKCSKVTRIQFYAIEIARNREGFNSSIRTNFKPKLKKAAKT